MLKRLEDLLKLHTGFSNIELVVISPKICTDDGKINATETGHQL